MPPEWSSQTGHRTVAVVGEFDGFHVGHRKLVSAALRVAGCGQDLAALVLHQRIEPQLTTLEQRLGLLRMAGVHTATVIDAAGAWSEVGQLVAQAIACLDIGTAILACAPGAATELKWGQLRPLLHRAGVEIVEVPRAADAAGRPITSTLVRDRVTTGDLDEVARLLERRFTISGIVEHGDERGRTIGFPTANLAFDPHAVWPGFGVYAGWVDIDGRRHAGAANIGNRPTVYGKHGVTLLEVHLLDFAGDLSGCSIGVELVSRVRSERRFSSLDELKAQLARDVDDARHRLGVSG